MKTSELIGKALDHAVAVALDAYSESGYWDANYSGYKPEPVRYSTDWAYGGPVVEQESINLTTITDRPEFWQANYDNGMSDDYSNGPTMLIAAMRCLVAAKIGDEIYIPKELQ